MQISLTITEADALAVVSLYQAVVTQATAQRLIPSSLARRAEYTAACVRSAIAQSLIETPELLREGEASLTSQEMDEAVIAVLSAVTAIPTRKKEERP